MGIVELVMKSNKSITELRKISKSESDIRTIVNPTLKFAGKYWKQIKPLLQKAIDAKEEGKTFDRDFLLQLFNSSNKDTKPEATSKKASVKEPSRSKGAASSTQVDPLSDRAQDPTSRRSIRKRSAPKLYVARPSVRDSGVEEGDEEFLAAFTLTDLRTSSSTSNSSQQSRHSLTTKKRSASTLSEEPTNQVETLPDIAQEPTNRRSIRKRSTPELFVARPSKISGVEEGDEEFLATFTLTDLRKSSSNSSQQSKHPSYYLLQEASVLFSGINETNAVQTFQRIDCLFSKGTQRDKNSRWKALKELHSKHPSYHLLESQRALNKTQKPTKKVVSKKKEMMKKKSESATKKRGASTLTEEPTHVEEDILIKSTTKETSSKKMMEKKSASLSEGDSSNNKATTAVKAGLKNCPELGAGWKVEMVPRKKGERKDKYYYSSTGERFRSLVQARASMGEMKIDNDDTIEIDNDDDESVADTGETDTQFFGHELLGPQLLSKTKYESVIPIGKHGNKLSLGTFTLASDAALAFDQASKFLNKNVLSSKIKQNFADANDHIEMRNKEMSERGIDDVDLKEVMTDISNNLNYIMSKIETP